MEKTPEVLKENIKFCRQPSHQYEEALDRCGGDPRSVIGQKAMNNWRHGWQPAWDSRDVRN